MTPSHPSDDDERPTIPLSTQSAVYATGAFANSSDHVVTVILPLWAVAIGASPLMIGVIIGSRHFLTALLSIHGGAIMDRFGARRILVALGVVATVSPLLFPTLPFVWTAILLQMIGGLASNYGWMGAQAQIGDLMRGSPLYAGRLTFFLRIGHLAAPPVAGFAWDVGGPWAGFGALSFWGAGILISSFFLPDKSVATARATPAALTWKDLLPRVSDYIDAFRLLAIPAVVLVVAVSILRMAGIGMQSSFYVIYLKQLGYTGTVIGLLIGAAAFLGFAGAISVTPLTRIFPRHGLLIVSVVLSILLLAITPLIAGFFVLLLAASALRGGTMGLAQPLMISILGQAAGAGNQGKGVGLRTTANRLASMLIPILMGTTVQFAGIEASFIIVGAALIALLALAAFYAGRAIPKEEAGKT